MSTPSKTCSIRFCPAFHSRLQPGNYDSPFKETEVIGKLDWQINNNYKAFFRFSYDQNHSVLAIIPNSFQPFGNVRPTPIERAQAAP